MSPSPGHAVRLVFRDEIDLADERLRRTIVAAAEGIAERTGVVLTRAEIESHALDLTVDGPPILALGLAAELRRHTDRWHRDRTGHHLWITPESDGSDESEDAIR